ncbi:hypothetical protein DY218_16720 [Streptomyces triticagri]|uniref:Uncharacterized protein n=1 Tax=Streptomyces triticagri TaxID=2293568 RepID=A0A372M573_9ACTN|nr:hypothetical protein DY218_16720 [Streptomyces triticagri]
MVRDLYNVRVQPAEPVVTPLTDEEEQRVRSTLFHELGREVAERGWARFPAYTTEERRRLVDVARRLTDHWGQQVAVEAEDEGRIRLFLTGNAALPAQAAPRD